MFSEALNPGGLLIGAAVPAMSDFGDWRVFYNTITKYNAPASFLPESLGQATEGNVTQHRVHINRCSRRNLPSPTALPRLCLDSSVSPKPTKKAAQRRGTTGSAATIYCRATSGTLCIWFAGTVAPNGLTCTVQVIVLE